MNIYTLTRTGDRPLTITAELLAGADSHSHNGPSQNRWYEVRLYQMADQRYVVATQYHTQWQGEHDHAAVNICADPAAVVEALRSINLPDRMLGFPTGYDERQAKIQAQLQAALDAAITEILAALPAETI